MAQGQTLLRRKQGDVFVYEKPPGSNTFIVRPDPLVARPSKKGYVTVRDLTNRGIKVEFPIGTPLNPQYAPEVDIDLSVLQDGINEYAVFVGPSRSPVGTQVAGKRATRTRAAGHSDPSIIVD